MDVDGDPWCGSRAKNKNIRISSCLRRVSLLGSVTHDEVFIDDRNLKGETLSTIFLHGFCRYINILFPKQTKNIYISIPIY